MNKITNIFAAVLISSFLGLAITGIVWNSTRPQQITFAEKAAVIKQLGKSLGYRSATLGKNEQGYSLTVESKTGSTITDYGFKDFELVLEWFKELKMEGEK